MHDSFDQQYGPLSVSEGKNVGIHFARGQYVVFVNQGKSQLLLPL